MGAAGNQTQSTTLAPMYRANSISIPITGGTYKIDVRATCPEVAYWEAELRGSLVALAKLDTQTSTTVSGKNPTTITFSENGIGNKSGILSVSGYSNSSLTCNECTATPLTVTEVNFTMPGYKRNIFADIVLTPVEPAMVFADGEYLCETRMSYGTLTINVPTGVSSSVTMSFNNKFGDFKKTDDGWLITIQPNQAPSIRKTQLTVTVTTYENVDYYSSTTVQTFYITQKAKPYIIIRQNGLNIPMPSTGSMFDVIVEKGAFDGDIDLTATLTGTIPPCFSYKPTAIYNVSAGGGEATVNINSTDSWSATKTGGFFQLTTQGGMSGKTVMGVTIDANNMQGSNNPRSGKITFSVGQGDTYELPITQTASIEPDPGPTPDGPSISKGGADLLLGEGNRGATGGSSGDGPTPSDIPNWCILTDTFSSEYGYTVNILNNELTCPRSMTLKVTATATNSESGLYSTGESSQFFIIRQDGYVEPFVPVIPAPTPDPEPTPGPEPTAETITKSAVTITLGLDSIARVSTQANPYQIDSTSDDYKNDGTDSYTIGLINPKIASIDYYGSETKPSDYDGMTSFTVAMRVTSDSWIQFQKTMDTVTGVTSGVGTGEFVFGYKVKPITSLGDRAGSVMAEVYGGSFEDDKYIYKFISAVKTGTIRQKSPQAWLNLAQLNVDTSISNKFWNSDNPPLVKYTGYGQNKAPVRTILNVDIPEVCAIVEAESKPGGIVVPITAESITESAALSGMSYFHLWDGKNGIFQRKDLMPTSIKTELKKYESLKEDHHQGFIARKMIPLGIDACTIDDSKAREFKFKTSVPDATKNGGDSEKEFQFGQEKYPLQDVYAYYFYRKDWKTENTGQSTPCPYYDTMQSDSLTFKWTGQHGSIDIAIPFCGTLPSVNYSNGISSTPMAWPGEGAEGTLSLSPSYGGDDLYLNIITYDPQDNEHPYNELYSGKLSGFGSKPVLFDYFCNEMGTFGEKKSIAFVLTNYNTNPTFDIVCGVNEYDPQCEFWYEVRCISPESNKITDNSYLPVEMIDGIEVSVYGTNSRLIYYISHDGWGDGANEYGDCSADVSSTEFGGQWISFMTENVGNECDANPLPHSSGRFTISTKQLTVIDSKKEINVDGQKYGNNGFWLEYFNYCYGWYNCHDYDYNEYPTAYLFKIGNENYVYMKNKYGIWEKKLASQFNPDELYDHERFGPWA